MQPGLTSYLEAGCGGERDLWRMAWGVWEVLCVSLSD